MRDVEAILARAELYGVCAHAFDAPGNRGIEDIREDGAFVTYAVDLLDLDEQAASTGREFADAATTTQPEDVTRNYSELFTTRQQCKLDEAEYDKAVFNRYQRMADVGGFYRAFGFEPSGDAHQRPDFIGLELEFMQLLLIKLAYAMEQGWDDKVEACRDAEKEFMKEHLAWWVPAMCENLRGASTCAYFKQLSDFLEAFIASEASRQLQPA
jgi:TorA maturation chaperone TorD